MRARIKTKSMMGTLVVLRLLRGLHGLSDLHADDVDLGLAVLQHLLSRLEELLVLRRDGEHREGDQREGGRAPSEHYRACSGRWSEHTPWCLRWRRSGSCSLLPV